MKGNYSGMRKCKGGLIRDLKPNQYKTDVLKVEEVSKPSTTVDNLSDKLNSIKIKDIQKMKPKKIGFIL